MPLGVSRYDDTILQRRLWTPDVLAKAGRLTRWWDMNDPATISIAASVLSVKDKVAGTTVALGAANSAILKPTGRAGRGILTNNSGSAKGTFTATGTGDHTFYFCSEPNTSGLLCTLMADNGNSGGGFCLLGFGWSDAAPVTLLLASNNGNILHASTTVPAGTPTIGSARTLSGGSQVYLNGKLDGTDSNVGPNTVGISILMDDNNVDPYGGVAYEWMYWVGRHSDAEMRQVEGYLAWKWGLQNKLAGSHPYRNRPPTIGG